MIPQLFIGGAIRKIPVRKWVWVTGSVGQGICVASIGVAALLLEGAAAGWTLLLLVALFSLARGLSSVAAKDVMGKSIPKPKRPETGWRGRLWTAASRPRAFSRGGRAPDRRRWPRTASPGCGTTVRQMAFAAIAGCRSAVVRRGAGLFARA